MNFNCIIGFFKGNALSRYIAIVCLGWVGAVTALAQPQRFMMGGLPETTYAWGVLHVSIAQRLIQDVKRHMQEGQVEEVFQSAQALEAALEHVRDVLEEAGLEVNDLMGLEAIIDGLMAVERVGEASEEQVLVFKETVGRIEQALTGLLTYVDLGVVERQRAYLVEELRNAWADDLFEVIEPCTALYFQTGFNLLGEERAREDLDTQDPLVRVLSGGILLSDDTRRLSKKRQLNAPVLSSCSSEARQFRDFF